jgi:glucokinase
MILGIDVGGTTVKFGVVSTKGEIDHIKAYDTPKWAEEGFVDSLKAAIQEYLDLVPDIAGIGIGWPGLLSVDRKTVIALPNIPAIKDLPITDILAEAFPKLLVQNENDAKCATIGELYFGNNEGLDNFVLVTLGTGVGSGAVIDKKLFLGARGNGMEIGHMVLENGRSLEEHIGISHIISYAQDRLEKEKPATLLAGVEISPKSIFDAAEKGDAFAISIFDYVGEMLGTNLVSVIRVLDITTILLGGGIAGAFKFIEPMTRKMIEKYLPPYYTKDFKIDQAYLTNQVGLLGAAGLLMDKVKIQVF